MASSPLRQPQSRLLDMQKKFQQKHLAAVGAVKASTTASVGGANLQPVPPVRRLAGGLQLQQQQQQQRKAAGSGGGTGPKVPGDGDALVQVDVKGKVRQLFAERNQNVQGPGHQQHPNRRQRRRSLTGRDRSRPLRPLSDSDGDPLCKTVCFTAPSLAGGADLVGISSAGGGDVRDELLALFGRLPNLGGRLLSETFRANGSKMKTAQSAPELKWLLDNHGGGGRRADAGDGGPGPPVKAAKGAANDDDDDDDDDGSQRPTGRINSREAVITKKPLAVVNGNSGVGGVGGPTGLGRGGGGGVKKPVVNGGGFGDGGGGGGGGKAAGSTNKLLLPPVVQPTVIHALAAGAGASAAIASVNAAAAPGFQKPLVRAGKLPPAQKPTPAAAPRRRAAGATPSPKAAAAAVAGKRPAVGQRASPAAGRPKPLAKQQLSVDRGPPAAGMARCPLCARDFAADRLPKHEAVCRNTRDRDRKRKVFDVSKKRLESVAAEAGVDVASLKKKSEKEDQRAAEKLQKKKDAWRRKHDALVRNVRAARAVQRHLAAGGSVRDLPPELDNAGPDVDDEADSDLVRCPHCNRTFNEASAERHIPQCAERQRNAAARMQNKKR